MSRKVLARVALALHKEKAFHMSPTYPKKFHLSSKKDEAHDGGAHQQALLPSGMNIPEALYEMVHVLLSKLTCFLY